MLALPSATLRERVISQPQYGQKNPLTERVIFERQCSQKENRLLSVAEVSRSKPK